MFNDHALPRRVDSSWRNVVIERAESIFADQVQYVKEEENVILGLM